MVGLLEAEILSKNVYCITSYEKILSQLAVMFPANM
jgi:hypothetical protein